MTNFAKTLIFIFLISSSASANTCGGWLQKFSMLFSNSNVGLNCAEFDGDELNVTSSVGSDGKASDLIVSHEPGRTVFVSGLGNTAYGRKLIRESVKGMSAVDEKRMLEIAHIQGKNVYPIVLKSTGEILGAAVHMGTYVVAPLHVVHGYNANEIVLQKFDKESQTVRDLEITAFAINFSGSQALLRPYQDLAVLRVRDLEGGTGAEIDQVADRFPVLDLSYPKGISSRIQGTVFPDLDAHVIGLTSQTNSEEDHMIVISLRGQTFASSGGAVINLDTQKVAGIEICKSDEKKIIYALRADEIYQAILKIDFNQASPYPWSNEAIRFTYEDDGCGPIGARGSGGGR